MTFRKTCHFTCQNFRKPFFLTKNMIEILTTMIINYLDNILDVFVKSRCQNKKYMILNFDKTIYIDNQYITLIYVKIFFCQNVFMFETLSVLKQKIRQIISEFSCSFKSVN